MHEAGVINIYKEKGYTSHDVVAIVRKTLSGIKTGHTGTLDPQAEGVLPVCVGRATKLADWLAAETKTYIAEVLLGLMTDTGDNTGQVTETRPVEFNIQAIQKNVAAFVGEYQQTPPMYSAVKINGQKLYELARKGVSVERAPKPVRIDRMDILSFDPESHSFTIEVTCSKGTYIRSLCADIGEALGCGACMGALTRTRSGVFTVEDAVKLQDFKQVVSEGRQADFIWPVERVLPYKKAILLPEGVKRAVNGNPVPLCCLTDTNLLASGERVWLYHDEMMVGLYTVVNADLSQGHLAMEVLFL